MTVMSTTTPMTADQLLQLRPKSRCELVAGELSPSDRTGEVNEKIRMWLSVGTRLVWVVDPLLRTVTCYRSADDVAIITNGGAVDGGDVVLGFSCAVADFFPPAR